MRIVCGYCDKTPDQIDEYVEMAAALGTTPNAYVETLEGTFNPLTGHFACTACYIRIGMPSSPQGWVAP